MRVIRPRWSISLDIEKVEVVGHESADMVAFSMAAKPR